jgi:hypothetical protein
MLQATFRQSTHAYQDTEEKETSYASYEELLSAIEEYLKPHMGRFTTERFELYNRNDETDIKTLETLMEELKEAEADVITKGHPITIYLQLGDDEKWGSPILQIIAFKCPEAYDRRISAMHERHMTTRGRRYCYCGEDDCDFECDALPCGCLGSCEALAFSYEDY